MRVTLNAKRRVQNSYACRQIKTLPRAGRQYSMKKGTQDQRQSALVTCGLG
jgi:hypothetical protein